MSRTQSDSKNAAANREERIRTLARELTLESSLVQELVRFMDQKFPLL